jgi:hypothetical protein
MGCFGGGSDVSYPAPSATEEAIRAKTLASLTKSEKLSDQFLPYQLAEMGYKVNTPAATPEDTARGQQLAQQIAAYDTADTGFRTDPANQAAQRTLLAEKEALDSKYGGTYSKMSEDEIKASMSPAELAQYEVAMLQADRTKKALMGELPISPQLEKNLGQNQTNMEEYLSRTVGPKWKGSTAGKQMTDMLASNELIREEARRGEISSGTQNLLQEMGFLKNAATGDINNMRGTASTYMPLVSGYSSALQPYQQDRAGTFNANQINAKSEADNISGNKALLGTMIGAALAIPTGGASLIPTAAKSAFSSSASTMPGGWGQFQNNFSYLPRS